MKKRIVKITGLTAAMFVISLILTLFVSAQSTQPSSISDVLGYEVTFKRSLLNPDGSSNIAYSWDVFFTCNNVKYQKMEWLNAGILMYGVYNENVEGLYDWTTVYNNDSWVNDNYRVVYFYGGDDTSSLDLTNFVNINNALLTVYYTKPQDPYTNMFEYIDNNLPVINNIKDNFDNTKGGFLNGVSIIGALASPAHYVYNEIGVAIAIGMGGVLMIALLKRVHVDRVNGHTQSNNEIDRQYRKAEAHYNDYYKDYMKYSQGGHNR